VNIYTDLDFLEIRNYETTECLLYSSKNILTYYNSKTAIMKLVSIKSTVTIIMFMSAMIVLLLASPAYAQDAESVGTSELGQEVTCGSVVTGTVTLRKNLNCNDDGLIIGDDSTTLNLNGFSIQGPGKDSSNAGISVTKDSAKILGPGVISGFEAGILLTGGSGNSVNSVILQNNQIGAFFTGSETSSVEENIMRNNDVGVAGHSADNLDITSNIMDVNALTGITFVNAHGSTITRNSIQESQNGVFFDSQSSGNMVTLNNLRDNVVDLNNSDGLVPSSNANTFSENTCVKSDPDGLCDAQ
jgi:nitrous oxidase accessory protein NosD